MAFKLANNVQETTTTTGTGTVTLAGAVSGSLAFSSQLASGDTTYYAIFDDIDLECGTGTYTNTSGQQLSRDSVAFSTNGGSKVNWGVGTRNVICGLPGSVIQGLIDASAGNGLLKRTGTHTYGTVTSTAAGESLLAAADAAAQRTLLGVAAANNGTHTGTTALAAATVSGVTSMNGGATCGADSPVTLTSKNMGSVSGAVSVSFATSSLKRATITGNITEMTCGSKADGRCADIRFTASGADRSLPSSGAGWATDWVWIGVRPTSLANGKSAILSLRCFGTAETDIIAMWGAQY